MQLSLLAISASLKCNIYQSKIIKQFGFEISKEMMDNILITCHYIAV